MEDLAFVILNYNSVSDTLRCVQILKSFSLNFKIIIVDNNSTDNSAELLEKQGIEDEQTYLIKSHSNDGYGAGNNIGIRFAEEKFASRYIGIINPDIVIPNKSVIINLYSLLKESDYAMVGGAVIDNEGHYRLLNSSWNIPTSKSLISERFLLKNRHSSPYYLKMVDDTIAEVECIAGCFFIIKAQIIKEINYFDENVFLYNEENIIGIKLRDKGYKSALLTTEFYYHLHNFEKDKAELSLKSKIKRDWVKYQSRKYLADNYYSKMISLVLLGVELVNCAQITVGHLKNNVVMKFIKGNKL